MSSFSRLITLALGLSALGCGVLAYQQYYLLQTARSKTDALEKEIAALREKLARQDKPRSERPSWPAASGSTGGPVPVAEAGTDSGGPVVTRPEGGGFNRARAFMESPQAQKLMAMQQKASLDGRYATLFRKLNLSPEDLEKFKTLLVERQTAAMDVMMAARNQGVDVRNSGAEITQLIQESQTEVDEGIRGMLGESGYQEYKDYDRTLPQRSTVNQLEQRLSYSNAPLRPDQADQLARILADTNPKQASDPRTMGGTFAVAAGGPIAMFGGVTSINDDALARAQGILTSSQLDALKQLQQEQQTQAQLAQEMRSRMRPGNGAPAVPGSPVLVPATPLPGGG